VTGRQRVPRASIAAQVVVMVQDPYSTVFANVSALDEAARVEMAGLYLDNYDGTSEEIFLSDLAKKDEALLVYSGRQLVGFTTLMIFEREWRSERIRVVYSGDTVVDRAHWGQQALAFDWIGRMGGIKRERPDVPLYWFLLVKGHRTYRYLPLFGKSFHPHWSEDRSDLKPLADALAGEMFPDDYNPATGVVEFRRSRGHLKSDIALPSQSDLDRQEVSFFLQRNPGFQRGHELVCVCEVEMHNMKPLTLKLFQKERNVG
jgi:hypothetical protein